MPKTLNAPTLLLLKPEMQTFLPHTLPDFGLAPLLVVGDVMLDRYWFGDASRISPEAPVPIVAIYGNDHRPGGAGNVALNIASLGAPVTLLGTTGQDEAADILSQQLAAASVKHDLIRNKGLATIVKLRIISRHQQLLRLDFESPAVALDEGGLLERFKIHAKNAKLIVLSDYKKGTLARPQPFIQHARQAGVPIIVDPKGNDFGIYQYANVITPNFHEFVGVVGPCLNEKAIIDKGRQLLLQFHFDALLLTRGEDGMTLIQAHQATHLPAYAREVFDVTGAGDTVIAVFGAMLAAGEGLLPAAAVANLAASQVVGKLGAAAVNVPELQVALTGKTNFATGILNEEQLLHAVNEVRAQGKKIVFTNGCFDLVHAGHVTSLQMAKQLGDYLIVAVNSDDSIRKCKGPDRPINDLDHRMIVLAGLEAVDWVVPFADATPERLLKKIKPDFLVKGTDYQLDQVVGAEIVRAHGGEVRIMNHPIMTSSTAIIERIQHNQEK